MENSLWQKMSFNVNLFQSLGTNSKENHDPDCVSDSYFLTLLCVVCFAHSSPLLLSHKAAQGHRAQRKRHWGRVGGPAAPSAGCRAGNKGGGVEGWRGGGGNGPINLPELVCESLRDSLSQGAVRGHFHPSLHRGAVVMPLFLHHHLLLLSIRWNLQRRPLPQAAQACDLHLWKMYGCCALCKTWGQICRSTYVTQTSQTPGWDERCAAHFSLPLLAVVSVLKCTIITVRDLCTPKGWRLFFCSCNTVGVRRQILQL